MITYYKKTLSDTHLKTLDKFKVGTLIEVTSPNEDEINFLVENFNLDKELLIDGLDENELPRFEKANDENYIFVNILNDTKDSLGTLLIIISNNFILTYSKNPVINLARLFPKNKTTATTQRGRLLIKILAQINSEFERRILSIVKTVRTKKNQTIKLEEKDFQTLLDYKDFLNELVSNYSYTSLLYRKIIKNIKFHEDDKEEVESLIIDSEESLNLCKNSLKTITNITNYYSIILSNKLNRTIKILTLVTVIINIPAAIGAIYGMNVPLPFSQSPYVFWYLLTLIIIIITFFTIYIRKKDLI